MYRLVSNFQDICERFNPGGSAFGPSRTPPPVNEAPPAPGGLPRNSAMPSSVPRLNGAFVPDAKSGEIGGYPALPNDSTK
jgi:hypothetical protein